MVRYLNTIFENGVLRPLEPLSLQEHQQVRVTISDPAPAPEPQSSLRQAEQQWLSDHGQEYRGEWVALQDYALLSPGPTARRVLDQARQKGVQRPLLVHLTDDFWEPSAGLLL